MYCLLVSVISQELQEGHDFRNQAVNLNARRKEIRENLILEAFGFGRENNSQFYVVNLSLKIRLDTRKSYEGCHQSSSLHCENLRIS